MVAPDAEQRARREAADWFGRLRSRSVATDELTEFAAWRRDPVNRRAYERIERLWDDSAAVGDDPEVGTAVRRALGRRRVRRWLGRLATQRVTLTVAASLAAAMVVILFVPIPNPWATQGFQTGIGERSVILLADGSNVRLDTSSRLLVRLTRERRRVELTSGQAYFVVRHDPRHPFVVDLGDGTTVTALGTRFDIFRGAGSDKVALYEGSVAVANASGASEKLTPGQSVIVRNGVFGEIVHDAGVGQPTWISGRLSFSNTPLDQAVLELNRYTVRRLRVSRPELGGQPVSGEFSTDDPDGFVAAANAIFGAGSVSRDGPE